MKNTLILLVTFFSGVVTAFLLVSQVSAEREAQARINGYVTSIGNIVIYLDKFKVKDYCFLINQAQTDLRTAKTIELWIKGQAIELSPTVTKMSLDNLLSAEKHLNDLSQQYDFKSCN